VGLFKRSDQHLASELEPLVLPSGKTVQVVGESYYQDALDVICGGKCEEGHQLMCQAELRPEPDNEYDKHAVGVYVDGQKVGYAVKMPRDGRPSWLLCAHRGSGRCAGH
jgi:hypothetical protein